MTLFTNFKPKFSKLKPKAIVLLAFGIYFGTADASAKVYLLLNEGDCNNCNRIPNEIIELLKEKNIKNFEIIVSNRFSNNIVSKKFNLDLSLLHVSRKKFNYTQSTESRSALVILNNKEIIYNEPLIFAIDDTPNWLKLYFNHSAPRISKTVSIKLKSSALYNWVQTKNHYTKEFIFIHSPFLNNVTIIRDNQIIDSTLTDLIHGKSKVKGLISENYLSAYLKDSIHYFVFFAENDSVIILKTDRNFAVKEIFNLSMGFYHSRLEQSHYYRINPNPFFGNGFFVDSNGGFLFQINNPNMSKNYVTAEHKDSFKPNAAIFKLSHNTVLFDSFLSGELPDKRIEEKRGYFNHFVVFENLNASSYLIADYSRIFYNTGKSEEIHVSENELIKDFIDFGYVKLNMGFNTNKRFYLLKKDFAYPVKKFKKRPNQNINFSQGKIIETSYNYITQKAKINVYEISW